MISAFVVITFFLAFSNGAAVPKESVQATDVVGGFALYRRVNGVTEWLLLEKAKEPGDWSPPKGNADPGEIAYDAAVREMREETTLQITDYDVLMQYYRYFEYETNDGTLKQVHLWPAELKQVDAEIVIGPETSEYRWLNNAATLEIIKSQYKQAYVDLLQRVECHYNISPC